MKDMDAALAAYDAAMAQGVTKAAALGAAAAVEGRPIVDVFNDLLAADALRFVAVDRPKAKPGFREGRPLVRVRDPQGRRVVDGWLVE